MASWRFEDDENLHYPINHIATHNQISNKHIAWMKYYASLIQGYGLLKKIIIRAYSLFMICAIEMRLPYSRKVWRGKVWQIDSFQAFGERKFGELIDQPIDY